MDPKPIFDEGPENHDNRSIELEDLGLSPELLGELLRGATLTRELLGPEILRVTPKLLKVIGCIDIFFPTWEEQYARQGEISTPIDLISLEEIGGGPAAEFVIRADELGTNSEYNRAKKFLENR